MRVAGIVAAGVFSLIAAAFGAWIGVRLNVHAAADEATAERLERRLAALEEGVRGVREAVAGIEAVLTFLHPELGRRSQSPLRDRGVDRPGRRE